MDKYRQYWTDIELFACNWYFFVKGLTKVCLFFLQEGAVYSLTSPLFFFLNNTSKKNNKTLLSYINNVDFV